MSDREINFVRVMVFSNISLKPPQLKDVIWAVHGTAIVLLILWEILFLAESRTILLVFICKKDRVGNMNLESSWNAQNISVYEKVCWHGSCLVLRHSALHMYFFI